MATVNIKFNHRLITPTALLPDPIDFINSKVSERSSSQYDSTSKDVFAPRKYIIKEQVGDGASFELVMYGKFQLQKVNQGLLLGAPTSWYDEIMLPSGTVKRIKYSYLEGGRKSTFLIKGLSSKMTYDDPATVGNSEDHVLQDNLFDGDDKFKITSFLPEDEKGTSFYWVNQELDSGEGDDLIDVKGWGTFNVMNSSGDDTIIINSAKKSTPRVVFHNDRVFVREGECAKGDGVKVMLKGVKNFDILDIYGHYALTEVFSSDHGEARSLFYGHCEPKIYDFID